ncbi:bile acid:sodium symporter family protein [Parashewanella curva]|uniref:Bile acid:sodium symporter family protein n=1 Tax=Parashewanella curva TaxID=2338552 RepID=A0A3L8Q162_9GAMM|nr:bile acid:sodium symporter family protein [Parashewanella curva]RLV61325.1 bile acid:sodium symporter family protein [Parashewanella curva]
MELATLTQLILPLALAMMMLTLGLSLSIRDFKEALVNPKPFIFGVTLQLLLLPLIAWLHILLIGKFIELPLLVTVGLVILASCPGGATSNLIAFLLGGNAALSVSMTAFVSLVMPVILPLSLSWQLSWLGIDSQVSLPFLITFQKLLSITIVPVIVGMIIRAFFRQGVEKAQPYISRIATILFFGLVVFMAWRFQQDLLKSGWLMVLMCLSVCILAMLVTQLICKQAKLNFSYRRTLLIEVGIQNAGTGMFIAAVILKQPEWTLLPMTYGLVMNIPILLVFVKDKCLQDQ